MDKLTVAKLCGKQLQNLHHGPLGLIWNYIRAFWVLDGPYIWDPVGLYVGLMIYIYIYINKSNKTQTYSYIFLCYR